MIEIVTLLHGLLMGPMEVELRVPERTAQVQIHLDGRVVATRSSPPWILDVPFDEEPAPSRLTVVAFDDDGIRLDVAERSINIDFAGCELPEGLTVQGATPFVIDVAPGVAEPLTTDLAGWFHIDGEAIEVLEVIGGPVEVIVVQDPETQNVFDRLSVSYLRQAAGASRSRLTRGDADRELLDVAASSLANMTNDGGELPETGIRIPEQVAMQKALRQWREFLVLDMEGRLHFLWPNGPPIARLEDQSDIFPFINVSEVGGAGLLWHLRQAVEVQAEQRLADATAVAAFQVASSCRRRVVLLFESVFSRDGSLLAAAVVRDYLNSIQVPLFVLRDLENSPGADAERLTWLDRWGATSSIQAGSKEVRGPTVDALVGLASRVQQSLERQRIVWLRGRHLPHDVEFRATRPGYTAVGRTLEEAIP